MKLSNRALTMLTTVILAAVAGTTAVAFVSLGPAPCNGPTTLRTFTLVSTLNGFNDSASHPGQQWPVMNVKRCDTVEIILVNRDSSQGHGLAVALYENHGVTAGPGEIIPVTFKANRAGQFKIYCSILCTIHPTMLNGVLNVS